MLLVAAIVYLVVFAAIVALGALRYRVTSKRMYQELRWARWDPIAPGPEHEPMVAPVGELVSAGYVLESFALLHLGPGRPRPSVVLGHPDGSVALVSIIRGARRYVVPTITTCLVPGLRWLETAAFPAVAEDRAHLVEVSPRHPAVPGLVERHRASRGWLAEQGLGLVAIPTGHAAREVEAQLRASADNGPPGFRELWINGLSRGGRLEKPLASRAGIGERLDEIRGLQRSAPGITAR